MKPPNPGEKAGFHYQDKRRKRSDNGLNCSRESQRENKKLDKYLDLLKTLKNAL